MVFKPQSNDHYYDHFVETLRRNNLPVNGIHPKSTSKDLIDYVISLGLSPGLTDYNLRQYAWQRDFYYFHLEENKENDDLKIILMWTGSEQQKGHHIEYSETVILGSDTVIENEHIEWNRTFCKKADRETKGTYKFQERLEDKLKKQIGLAA